MKIGWGDYGMEMRLTFELRRKGERKIYDFVTQMADIDGIDHWTERFTDKKSSVYTSLVIPLWNRSGALWEIVREHGGLLNPRNREKIKQDILRLVAEEEAKEALTPADPGINYCQMRIRTVITPDGKRVEGLEPMSGPGLESRTAAENLRDVLHEVEKMRAKKKAFERGSKMEKVTLVEEVVVRALRKRLNEIPDMVWGFDRKMRLGLDIEGAVRKILRYGIADEAESKTEDDCCKVTRTMKAEAHRIVTKQIKLRRCSVRDMSEEEAALRRLCCHYILAEKCQKCGKTLDKEE